MKRVIAILILMMLSLSLLTACGAGKGDPPTAEVPSYSDYTDFFGKTIGLPTGYILDVMIENDFGGTVAYYSDSSAGVEDVRHGRIAAFMTDFSIAGVICAQPGNEDMQVIPIPYELFSGPLGAISKDQDVIGRFDAFLADIKADGTLTEMQQRWIEENPGSDPPMPDIPLTGENGVLKVAIGDGSIPFCYIGANGELKGFCAELIQRFAAREGMTVDFVTMEFSAVLTYTASGKADLGIDAITITEERKKSMLFSDSFYDDRAGIIALKQAGDEALDYTDFIGKRFAVKNGTIYDPMSREVLQSSETLLFEDYPSIYEALMKGRADAGMRGYYAAYVSMFESEYAGLAVITLPEDMHSNPVGAISMDQETIDAFNQFLSIIQADGTYDDMKARWFDTFDPGNVPAMPDIPLSGENGTLTVAISSDYMPFSFLGEDGVNLGFDIELASRFAAYLKKDIVFADMAFSGLLPYITSGKADIAVSDITITEERKQSVLFTEPYFVDLSAIIYKKDAGNTEKGSAGLIEWLKSGVERNLIKDNRWKMIVNGLGVTMVIALVSQLLGTVLGCFVCWLLTRKGRFIQWIGRLYCGLIHGTPMVVLLMITYYIIFGSTSISNILVAIAAFTMVTGAGVAGNLKGAIDTVDPVEIEAARGIGFPAFKAFMTITLPQAIRRALPGYTGGFVELVKGTAIVGYIAIQDLTRAGDIIRSRTYDAYFPLLLVAVIYLIITTICVYLFNLIVKKANGGMSR